MRFLIDAQLPPSLAERLTAAGHEAEHVFGLLPSDATDAQIAAEANRRMAVLISKDEDFAILATRGLLVAPLLWIRAGNMTSRRLWEILRPLLPMIEASFAAGERIVEVR